jgi:hypothetical protein
MSPLRLGVFLTSIVFLSGCGLRVPDIQEFWGTPRDTTHKVNKIAAQVVCELRRAVQQVFWDNEHNRVQFVAAPGHPVPRHRDLSWFEKKWSAQVTLSFNIVGDLLPKLSSFIRRVCSGYAPMWGVLRTQSV